MVPFPDCLLMTVQNPIAQEDVFPLPIFNIVYDMLLEVTYSCEIQN